MSKLPQPTDVLVRRLRRVAKWLDELATSHSTPNGLFAKESIVARANTCWQTAGRLEEHHARLSAMCPGANVDDAYGEAETDDSWIEDPEMESR